VLALVCGDTRPIEEEQRFLLGPDLQAAWRRREMAPVQTAAAMPADVAAVVRELVASCPRDRRRAGQKDLPRSLQWTRGRHSAAPQLSAAWLIQPRMNQCRAGTSSADSGGLKNVGQQSTGGVDGPTLRTGDSPYAHSKEPAELAIPTDEARKFGSSTDGGGLVAYESGAITSQSMNNFKHHRLAMHNIKKKRREHRVSPCELSKEGKPLLFLSWRS